MKVLFATHINDPDWKEQLITEVESSIPAAKKWAEDNGFNRLRVAEIDLDNPPVFDLTLIN